MPSAPLIALLLTLGCAAKYPPKLIVQGHPARPWAYEGDAPHVKGSIAWYSAADLDRISREYVGAKTFDFSVPTTAPTTLPTTAPQVVLRPGEFRKGTGFASVYGAAIFGDEDKGEMYTLQIGLGYYFMDYQSLSLEPLGGYVASGIDDHGVVIGLDGVYRNHFLRDEDDNRTIFFEAGLGLQQQSTNFSGDRHFNFRIRLGFGATLKIDEDVRAFFGANYQHISDAGIEGGINAGGGFDGPMLYAGVMFPL